jgi:adenosylhomocysteine nucleosidase
MPEFGIVAALEREVWPLIRHWKKSCREEPTGQSPVATRGARLTFYETTHAVLICGGIGAEAARSAAEALMAHYAPAVLISAGYAGGLAPHLPAGGVFGPSHVVNAETGERFETGVGAGTLVTSNRILNAAAKSDLRTRFDAVAVDMEAAAVAAVARAHGARFLAVKAIYDAGGFSLPPLTNFIDRDGRFLTSKYVAHAALRPWSWHLLYRMATISARASASLCEWLSQIERGADLQVSGLKPAR